MSSTSEPLSFVTPSSRAELEMLLRGVEVLDSVADLAAPGIFESDDEVDELLAFVREDRNSDVA